MAKPEAITPPDPADIEEQFEFLAGGIDALEAMSYSAQSIPAEQIRFAALSLRNAADGARYMTRRFWQPGTGKPSAAAKPSAPPAGGNKRVLSPSQHDELTVEISKARMASGLALGMLMDLHGPAIPPGVSSTAEDIGYLVSQAQGHLTKAADTAAAAERVPA